MKEPLNKLQAAHVLYPAGEAPERHQKNGRLRRWGQLDAPGMIIAIN